MNISSSNLYNLRRSYNSTKNEEKDLNDSKSKVYTFNENEGIEKDYVFQSRHQNENFITKKEYKDDQLKSLGKQNVPERNSSKQEKYMRIRQSSPLELNRYLKEYQYNCFRLNDGKKSDIKMEKMKTDENFSSNEKIRRRNLENTSQSKPLQNSINLQREIFNASKKQTICSKQQIALIRLLRTEIDQLKVEIQKKNVYIQKLEQKLQNHLVDRIYAEKLIEENTQLLENNILDLKIQNQQMLRKLMQNEKQIQLWKNLVHKINFLFSDQQPIFSKTIFLLNETDLEQKLISFVRQLQDMATYKKLIAKICEMQRKIQYNKNVYSQQDFKYQNLQNEEINLKSLWKWLKKIGKEYEIMKQKVSVLGMKPIDIK